MTWKTLAHDLARLAAWAAKLAYPLTKRKLHRICHVVGTALAVVLFLSVWSVGHLSLGARLGADLLVLATYLTRWQVAVGKLDQVVDRLPIPEDDVALAGAVRSPGAQGPGTST